MNIDQPRTDNRLHRNLAVLSIVIGVVMMSIHLFSDFSDAPPSWKTVGAMETLSPSRFESIQPKPDDWPLIIRKQLITKYDGGAESYTVRIAPIRGTDLIGFAFEGQSADHTRTFAAWMMDSFAQDLRRSYPAAHAGYPPGFFGIEEAAPNFDTPELAMPLRTQWLVPFHLLVALFLLTIGVLLFRGPRCPGHDIQKYSPGQALDNVIE